MPTMDQHATELEAPCSRERPNRFNEESTLAMLMRRKIEIVVTLKSNLKIEGEIEWFDIQNIAIRSRPRSGHGIMVVSKDNIDFWNYLA